MADSIQKHFADLPDPRRARGRRHRLSDMMVIAVTAVICCADGWADVADFGNAKRKWFETFLDLPHGIRCADTFERDRKSTRLNSSHSQISYAGFCSKTKS